MKRILLIFSLLWGVSAVGQTKSLSDDLIFSFPMDGTATDVSGNSRNGTIAGAVVATTDRFGNPSGALQFNSGTDNKTAAAIDIAYGSAAGQTIGTSNFTTSFWVSYGTSNTFPGVITKEKTNVNPNQCRFGGYDKWANTFVNGTGSDWDTVNFSPTLNQWYHYVVVRNAATLSVYINGQLFKSKTNASGTLNHTGLDNYRIGGNQGGLSYFNGKLDDLRMYSRALTASEITALYNSDNLQAYYPLNGDAKDYSGNSFNGTLPTTNVTAVADRLGKTNSAYYFGGGNTAANIIKTTAKQVAVTNYSVSAWVKMERNEYGAIVTNRNDGNNTSCRGIALDVTNLGRVRMGVSGAGLWRGSTTTEKTVNDGRWHYITGVFSCPSSTGVSSSNFTIYVDGNPVTAVAEIGGAGSATSPLTSDGFTWIGESQDFYRDFSATTKGIIDEVKIYTRSLSATEIRQQFVSGSASIQGGPLLYYPLDGNPLDYSGNGLDASISTTYSGVTATTDRFGNANSAYLFGGTNKPGSINRATDTKLNFQSTDSLTFSCWINLTSFAGMDGDGKNQDYGVHPFFDKNAIFGYWYTHNRIQFKDDPTNKGTFDDTYKSNLVGQWNHVALILTPKTEKVFINGKLVLTDTVANDLSLMNSAELIFGHAQGFWYPLNGSLDDIRLYKRELSQAEIAKLADDKPNTLVQNSSASTIPNPFTTSNVFTAEMWVKPAATSANYQGFFGNTSGDTRIVPCMWVNGSNLHFWVGPTSGTYIAGTLPDFFSPNQWTHVAWVSDGKTCYFYKNGELRYTCPMTVTALTATTNIKLGGADNTTIIGQMDEVRVWSTARTQQDIKDNMYKELGAGMTGLSASYSFNGSFKNAIGTGSGTFGSYAQLFAGSALRTVIIQPATNITATGFTANWKELPTASSYQLQYSTTADFASATLKTVATNSLAVTNVDSVYLRVRALLTTGDTTAWSAPYRASRLFTPAGLAVSLNPTNLSTADVTQQYIQVPSDVWFNGDFTVDAWVNIRNNPNTWTRLFDFGNGPESNNVLLALTGPNMYTFSIRSDESGSNVINGLDISTVLPLKQWTHIAVTMKGYVVTIYVNGQIAGSSTFTRLPRNIIRNQCYIARSNWTATTEQYSNVIIDEFHIYNKALTKEELNTRMNQHLLGNEDGLLLYYDFDNMNGNNIADRTGKGKDATLLTANTSLDIPTLVKSGVRIIPTMRPASNFTTTGFTANWDAFAGINNYQVQYSATAAFASATSKIATTNSLAITGVDSVYLRVRAIFAAGDTSAWSNSYRASRLFAPAGLAVSLNPTNVTSDVTAHYVKVPSGAWFKGDFTVSTWVYIKNMYGYCRIFDFGNGSPDNNVLFDPSRGLLDVYNSTTSISMFVNPVPTGKWVNVAITQANGLATIYYDGLAQTVTKGQATINKPTGVITTKNYIGGNNWSSEKYLNMMLDEFCIYNKALTQTDVQARMNQHLSGKEDGLILYYDFDNINGNNITDRTGNGKDANLVTAYQSLDIPKLVKSTVPFKPQMLAASNVTPSGFTANWGAMAGISNYQVQMASKSDFSDATEMQTLAANSLPVTPSYSPVYFRARAVYVDGSFSDWGTTTYFTAPGNGIDLQNPNATPSSAGTGKCVQVPAGKWLSGNFTVDAWVFVRTNIAYQRLFDFGTTDGTTGGANNKVLTLTGNDSNNPYFRVTSGDVRYLNTSFPLNQWSHVALSNDSTNKTSKVYINGELVYTGAITSSSVTCTSNFIGRSNWSQDNYTNAIIDEFHISNQALSRDSIIARSHRHLSGKESDLVLYYDFDQISGNVVPNLAVKTGSAFNGTVMNSAPFVDSKAIISPLIRKVDTTVANQVLIAWDKVSGANYEVQTAETADFAVNFQTAKSTTDTAFTATLAANQSACFYRVRTTAPFDTSAWQTGVVTIKNRGMQNMAYQGVGVLVANTTDIQISGSDQVTMGCWLKFSAITDGDVLFQSGSSGKSGKWVRLSGAKLQVLYDQNNGAGWQSFECPVTISANTWYHFAYSLDANKKMTMYLNGAKYIPTSNIYGTNYDNTLQSAQASAAASLQSLTLGNTTVLIDNFQIWKTALPQDSIIKYANAPVKGTETNLAVAYNFNQIDGATIADLATTNATPATVVNNALLWKSSNAELTPLARITAANDSSLTVAWGKVPGATSYKLKYATKSDFSDAQVINQTELSKLFDKLLPSTNYYFSAKVITATDSSDWSVPVKGSLLGINDSLIAYYPFNSSAKDESGNGADGTISSSTAVTPTNDRFGNSSQAYKFDKGYITVPGTKNNLDGSYTIAAWVNSTPTALADNSHAVVSKFRWKTNTSFDGYMLSLAEGAGQLTQVNTSDPKAYNMDPKNFPLQQWKFVCATYSADKTLTLWIDGDTVLTKKNVAPNVANAYTFYIGSYYDGNAPFQGTIDDIRLYRRPLSKKEIATLYHQNGWPYTGIAISKNTLTEQLDKGAEVGKLRPQLADGAKNTCAKTTYKLIAGTGSTDNDKFVIENDSILKTAFIFDTTKQRTANIRVQATTCDGIIVEGVVAINIVGNAKSEVYTFNNLNEGNLNGQDAWKSIKFKSGDGQITTAAGQDGTKALVYNESGSGYGFAASKTIASMFPVSFKSLTQDSIQTTLSYDVYSSAWGAYFGLKARNGSDVFVMKVTSGGEAETFTVLGKQLPLVNAVPNDWTRVAITFAMIDAKTAELSVRARTLADANSAWVQIVAPARFAVDSTAANTSESNPNLWDSVAIKNYGALFKLDNIALTKRTVNPSRTGINDGLLAYYNMDNNMRDTSGNHNNGEASTATPVPTATFDRFKQINAAYHFDGTQNFAVAGMGKKLPASNVSFSVWAKEDEVQASSLFVLSDDIGTNRVNAHVLWGGTTMYWDYGNISGNPGRLQTSGTFNTDWHHYVFISGDNGMKMYIDNVLIAEKAVASKLTPNDVALLIGSFANANKTTGFFKGSMDDLRIYNRELTPDDINVLYTEGGWPIQSIKAYDMTLEIGTSGALKMDVTPANAPTTGLIYTSGDTKIATVTNAGIVRGIAEGKALITASTSNGLIKSTAVVTVTNTINPITSITLADTAITLLKGQNYTFKYSIYPTTKVVTSKIVWSSTNGFAAPVNNGTLSALSACRNAWVYVYADSTDKKVKDSCKVTVLPSALPTLSSDTVSRFSLKAIETIGGVQQPKDTLKLSLTDFFVDDSVLTFSYSPVLSSSDTIQLQLSNNVLLVYPRDTLSQKLPLKITITATDVDNQQVNKVVYVQMKSTPDLAPKVSAIVVDTLRQFRKSATVDLRKYVIDDYTAFASLVFDSLKINKRDTASIKNGIVTLTVRPGLASTLNDTLRLQVSDARKQRSVVTIPYVYQWVNNVAPKFASIDTIKQKTSDTTIVFHLNRFVKDDYTPISKLKWSFEPAQNVNIKLKDSTLYLSASSSAWDGTEAIKVYAQDEAGSKGSTLIPFRQIVNLQLSGAPIVDFELTANGVTMPNVVIQRGTNVALKILDKSNNTIAIDSWKWVLDGVTPSTINGSGNNVIQYNTVGLFNVTLYAINGTAPTKVTRSGAVQVVGIMANRTKVCTDSTATLWASDSSSGNQYQWSTGATTASIEVKPTKDTTISVIITKGSATIKDTVRLTYVKQLANVADNLSICPGETKEIKPQGFTSLVWNGASLPSYTATKAEKILVKAVVDAACSEITDEITVSLSAAPKLKMPISTVTICEGSKDTIVVGTKDGSSFQWNQTAGVKNDTLFANAAGDYIVTATLGACKTVDTLKVAISKLPSVTAFASATNVCKGSLVTLSTDEQSGLQYEWNVSRDKDGQASVVAVGNNDYYVTASDASGCKATDSVRVVAEVPAKITIAAMPNDTVCANTLLTLTATGATSYLWSDGVVNAESFAASINHKFFVSATSGTCVQRDSISIVVNQNPVVNIEVKPSSVLCKGDSLTVTANGGEMYKWNGTVVNGKKFAVDQSTRYVVTVTDANKCVTEQGIDIVVNEFKTFKIVASKDSICAGDSVMLDVQNAVSFTNDGLFEVNKYIKPQSNGINSYKALGTDANGCKANAEAIVVVKAIPSITNLKSSDTVCKGVTTVLTAQGTASSYVWDNDIQNGITFSPTETKSYHVTATEKGCSNTDSIIVVVKGESTISVKTVPSVDTAICAGASVKLSAATDGVISNIVWENYSSDKIEVSPKVDTTFTVVVTDEKKCVLKKSIPVRLNALPKVTAKADTTIACRGKEVALHGGGAVSYEWNDKLADGAKRSITETTVFTVTGTDVNNCANTATVSVTALKPFKEQIGVVTYDSTTGSKVIIAWNRHKDQRTERYVVLRQTTASQWDSIGGRVFTDTAYIVDPKSNGAVQTYSYKLVTVDNCQNKIESDEHRTMHVTNTIDNKGGITVRWNTYIGFVPELYTIVRVDENGKSTVIGTAPNNADYIDFTDATPKAHSSYRVLFDVPLVSPLLTKSDSGPFSQSMSNMSEASLVDVEKVASLSTVKLSPNPATSVIDIAAEDEIESVALVATDGRVIKRFDKIGINKTTLSVDDLQRGFYSLVVTTAKGVVSKRIELQ